MICFAGFSMALPFFSCSYHRMLHVALSVMLLEMLLEMK